MNDVSALLALAGDFDRARTEIHRYVGAEVRSTANAIRRDGRANARRISRHIPATIEVTGPGGAPLTSTSLEAEIGPTLFWAHIPERGSSQQAPRPYMGPAADKHEGPFAKRLADLGARLIS